MDKEESFPINLNNFRKNIYQYAGIKPCPSYGEDGVLEKIFNVVGISVFPQCIEFGELRVLGSTSRFLRLQHKANAFYFSATYDLYSVLLNVLDIARLVLKGKIWAIKFLRQLPKQLTVTPLNVDKVFRNVANKSPDLVVCDIDSFDFEVVSEMFRVGFRPRVFVVEYNPSLPYDTPLYLSYNNREATKRCPRLYGVSYAAWKGLFDRQEYALVHVSGFCNLFYVDQNILSQKGCSFVEPSIVEEITDTDEKVRDFALKYCLPDFLPSWFGTRRLTEQDLRLFETHPCP